MTYTEDNYGKDGKVNLSSLPADINWQGLEGLYSVNESIYEYRQNYRLSLVDWTNYLKDVDRVFALLNSHYEQNKTTSAPSDVFPVVSAELSVPVEMASAESDEDPGRMIGEAPHLTLPADLRTLHLNRPILSPENKLEWDNDIPEVNHLNSEHWRNHKTDMWMGREELSHLGTDLSGNGMTELVLKHGPGLQAISRHQEELPQDGEPGEDVFEEQLYLPVHAKRTSVHQTFNASTEEPPVNSNITEMLTKVEKNYNRETMQHLEGSASSPLPSD